MKFRILIFAFLFSTPLFSQDTTWVQTFTFDSITTRRANFEFPQDLNNKRFEKVLMYYKLKCSPLTTWDQYNCGEWDYLTYTRVYNHTGLLDSVRVDGNQYLSNWDSPDTISIAPLPTPHYDYFYRMIVKNKMKGIGTKKNELFGYFRRGGFSSKISFKDHFI